jgi:spore coat protein A, manganese oxidase
MTSRIPVPMTIAALLPYRWKTKLVFPVSHDFSGVAANNPATLYAGVTTLQHTFAEDSVSITNGTTPVVPPIRQTVWGYGLSQNLITYPGPTFFAAESVQTEIRLENNLPKDWPFVHTPHEMLPVASTMKRYSAGHTLMHLHGAHVPWTSDGYPTRMPEGARNPPILAGTKTVLRVGENKTYTYPNTQRGGATLWYHDHTMDMTARNVYAGLAGMYLLRHAKEKDVALLPKDAFEQVLVLQDRSFTREADAQGNRLLYADATSLTACHAAAIPATGGNTVAGSLRRSSTRAVAAPAPEFKGQCICVNGKIWPHMLVEPQAYRFRILNGSNSRYFVLRLSANKLRNPAKDTPDYSGVPAGSMIQIGGDGGFLPAISQLNGQFNATGLPTTKDFLVLAPGERADVVLDFANLAGQHVYLTNHARPSRPGAPFGNGGDLATIKDGTKAVLQFRVANLNAQPSLDTNQLNINLGDVRPNITTHLLQGPASSLSLPTPVLQTRLYVVREFGPVPLTNLQIIKGWNAITFQSNLKKPRTPGLLWGGGIPYPFGLTTFSASAVPAGGPEIELIDRLSAKTAHKISNVVELWGFLNRSPDVHPMHLHLAQFRVYAREPIPTGSATNIKNPAVAQNIGVDTNEFGWKDTVRCNPGEITWLLVRFDDDGDTTRDYSGHFVFHCHLLEHEDMGMMRPLPIALK